MKIGINIHPTAMKLRVLRGGSYTNDSWDLRTTNRDWSEPEDRFRFIGFRLVIVRRAL